MTIKVISIFGPAFLYFGHHFIKSFTNIEAPLQITQICHLLMIETEKLQGCDRELSNFSQKFILNQKNSNYTYMGAKNPTNIVHNNPNQIFLSEKR